MKKVLSFVDSLLKIHAVLIGIKKGYKRHFAMKLSFLSDPVKSLLTVVLIQGGEGQSLQVHK
jgi:hypothetical protein